MKKLLFLSLLMLVGYSSAYAQFVSVDLMKPTDTLFFKLEPSIEEITNTVSFKLGKEKKFNFGQVQMKAHAINPFRLPKILLNDSLVNTSIYFTNLDKDFPLYYYNTKEIDKMEIKTPEGENAVLISFVFSNKELLPGDNEIKIIVSEKDHQDQLAITDMHLTLRGFVENDILFNPAQFPGGQQGWIRHLMLNLDRDLTVKNGAPIGIYRIKVNFTIDKDGKVIDLKTDNDPGFGLAQEAIRVIEKGPKWIPATKNGVNINYHHSQTIVFMNSN